MILDDLRAWVIAYAGSAGQGYVGRPDDDANAHDPYSGCIDIRTPYVLASGYLVTPPTREQPSPGLARPHVLFPLELLASSVPLRVHYSALLRLRDLDAQDFKALGRSLLGAIEQAEAMRQGIRQQRSGIVLAPTGLKV